MSIEDKLTLELIALRKENAELRATIARQERHDADLEPEALEDDAILSKQDIDDLCEQAKRLEGDRAGPDVEVPLAPHEVVTSRSEYVAMARNLRALHAKNAELRAKLDESHKTIVCLEAENEAVRLKLDAVREAAKP